MFRLALAGGAFKSLAQPLGTRCHCLSSILPAARARCLCPGWDCTVLKASLQEGLPAQVLRAQENRSRWEQ